MLRIQSRYLARGVGAFLRNEAVFPRLNLCGPLSLRFSSTDKKGFDDIQRTVKRLREEVEIQQLDEPKKSVSRPWHVETGRWIVDHFKNPKKLLYIGPKLWYLVRDLFVHTWHGLRLYFLEASISLKYMRKLKRRSLTRRERNQLFTTLADTLRLAPFMVFIIVPFMDFLIPFYIKFFPQMLPSTFHGFVKENESNLRQFKVKLKAAKFLRNTLDEIAEINEKKIEEALDEKKAYEFSQFLKKVREQEDGYVTNADLFKFIKLFEDELTLDNLNDSQLQALCRLLGIARIGTKEILRFRLQMKLKELQADDRLIAAEGGAEMLSIKELQAANKARGMRAYGVTEKRLQDQLKQWLELSLDDKVPPSLLLLSRAMFFPEELNFTERLRSIIASLPEEIGEHTTLKLKELEGIDDPKTKIEKFNVLKKLKQLLNLKSSKRRLKLKLNWKQNNKNLWKFKKEKLLMKVLLKRWIKELNLGLKMKRKI
ncbi:unnamed protein product [Meloidogyne enterolobii]|uniref:Uncharacterized protein n=1 Tax=Meloidogyne enterolobii TaxID=390850 RepID=A0ACB0YJ40_MELEN